jgi:hypothetical protein
MILIFIFNYFVFLKGKRFLDYNFKKDNKGGIAVIFYLIISLGLVSFVANLNFDKIEQQLSNHPSSNPKNQKPSLEGEIRKWFNDTF